MAQSKQVQHYVPAFLLRRFTIEGGDKVYCLDKDKDRIFQVGVSRAAAINHFYSLETEDGNKDTSPEEFLSTEIEDHAAHCIQQLIVPGQLLTDSDRQRFSRFVHLTGSRTPLGRQLQRENNNQVVKLALRMYLAEPTLFQNLYEQSTGKRISLGEAEALCSELIPAFESEEVDKVFNAIRNKNKEIQQIFQGIDPGDYDLSLVINNLTWKLVRPPEGEVFILSDAPLSLFDESPRYPWAGPGYMSSKDAMTQLPLDPKLCLVLEEGDNRWRDGHCDSELTDSINLLTYAQAQRFIYGPSIEIIQEVHDKARSEPDRIAVLRLGRPPNDFFLLK